MKITSINKSGVMRVRVPKADGTGNDYVHMIIEDGVKCFISKRNIIRQNADGSNFTFRPESKFEKFSVPQDLR